MSDSFGGSDDDFDEVVNEFNAWLATNGLSIGLTSGQVTAIQTKANNWTTKFADHNGAQTAAATATQEKDVARAELTELMRPAALRVTDAAGRTAAGLNVPAAPRARVPVPTTRPVLLVNNSQRLQQAVTFRDEATPQSRRKPDGVMGCEIRCYIGDTPPADPEDYTFCTIHRTGAFVQTHDAANAKKNAHFVGRWVNTRNEKGPWSETVMSTISA